MIHSAQKCKPSRPAIISGLCIFNEGIEIIAVAERAGTYELSVLPHQDCCSFLQPQHPATRSTPAACEEAEAALDVEVWARRLQHDATVTVIQHRWDEQAQDVSGRR